MDNNNKASTEISTNNSSSPIRRHGSITLNDLLDADTGNAAPFHLSTLTLPAVLDVPFKTGGYCGANTVATVASSSRSSSQSRGISCDFSPCNSVGAVRPYDSCPSSANSSLAGDFPGQQVDGGGDTIRPVTTMRIHIDPDIFLDHHGLEQLDLDSCHGSHGSLDAVGSITGGGGSVGVGCTERRSGSVGLTPVCERMGGDSLEDCHAFTDLHDVVRRIAPSGGGMVTPTAPPPGVWLAGARWEMQVVVFLRRWKSSTEKKKTIIARENVTWTGLVRKGVAKEGWIESKIRHKLREELQEEVLYIPGMKTSIE